MARRLAALAATLAALASCKTQPCPTPLEECDGQCIDVQSNRSHCGACGNACAAGRTCLGGSCIPGTRAPCPERVGGAFVTFGACGQAVKLWIHEPGFIDEAAQYVLSTTPARTPVLAVLAGTDCDSQWTWSANDATPVFQSPVTAAGCDACPRDIQANVPAFVHDTGAWCPGTVLAVDRRSAP